MHDGFDVEVPRDAIFTDDWQGYVPLFEAAGRRAALASTRVGPPVLWALDRDPNGGPAVSTGRLCWAVWLDFDWSWADPWECDAEVPF